MAKLNISGFLRTYAIAFGRVVINHSDVFAKVPTNRNTHVLVTRFNFLIFLGRLAPFNFVETQQFNFVQLSQTRVRNITLSKLEWKYTEKCSVVIVTQFSPPTVGSWTLQI